jgi:uncharacterized protein YoxC
MFCNNKKLTQILLNQEEILGTLNSLTQRMDKMATTLAQLDAAIAAENVTLTSLVALSNQLITDVNALVAKVGSGADFTNELNAVQANAALLQTASTNVQTADSAANPPAAPAPSA